VDIINRTGRDEGMVRTVAQHSSVAGEIFVVFLDDASAGTGHHAFAVSRRTNEDRRESAKPGHFLAGLFFGFGD
jgi:hypothetical protein